MSRGSRILSDGEPENGIGANFPPRGGMPLKIIWALFDIVTIIILVSGLYLWFARRKAQVAQIARWEEVSFYEEESFIAK